MTQKTSAKHLSLTLLTLVAALSLTACSSSKVEEGELDDASMSESGDASIPSVETDEVPAADGEGLDSLDSQAAGGESGAPAPSVDATETAKTDAASVDAAPLPDSSVPALSEGVSVADASAAPTVSEPAPSFGTQERESRPATVSKKKRRHSARKSRPADSQASFSEPAPAEPMTAEPAAPTPFGSGATTQAPSEPAVPAPLDNLAPAQPSGDVATQSAALTTPPPAEPPTAIAPPPVADTAPPADGNMAGRSAALGESELEEVEPIWKNKWVIGAIVALLVAVGALFTMRSKQRF